MAKQQKPAKSNQKKTGSRTTGYRTDPERHRQARMKVPAKRRKQIARMGGLASQQTPRPLTPEGRKRLAEAARKRWAAFRKARRAEEAAAKKAGKVRGR